MFKKIMTGFIVFVGIFGAEAYAEDPFEITIQAYRYDGGVYYQLPLKTIKVQGAEYDRRFKVVIKNISSGTQRLDIDTADNGLGQIFFEVTDENENRNVVTKKADLTRSQSRGYVLLGPGNTKEFEIFLSRGEWENAFKLVKDGASRLRARAVYKNGSNTICSDYYTIVLE
jgi:hypothetical protein